MASVTLTDIWIHNIDDFSDFIALQHAAPVSEDYEVSGSVRMYAGGRKRYVGRVGQNKVINISIQWASRDDLSWLKDNIGETVMIRDTKGRLTFGVYEKISINDRKLYLDATISVRVNEITYSLEV